MPLVKWMISSLRNFARRIGGGKTVGVRALIIDESDRVLLVRHTYLNGWFTPGGGVNAGETLMEALRREVFEETTLQITGEVQLFNAYFSNSENRDDYPVLYVIREFSGTARIGDAAEIAEIGWFPIDALPESTSPKTRQRVSEFRGLCPKSERW
ncbi:NUDIX domain-containing protein [Pandoraea anhela]|uniref:ADP-ribose pyrophosphatase n=1 Tax=Pandoraea anhela TaxID=2508295 RepID=A0A5E4UX13_9BURK|nr:NUDIX domain-containing protein [Pandoraea anhela]VVE04143.1 ADP-ribose pyrophosphatase [Pandoraea anhela]